MALYELTKEQSAAVLEIIGNASILGRAAPIVASIIVALQQGVEPNADTAERAGVQQANGAAGTAVGADANSDGDSSTA